MSGKNGGLFDARTDGFFVFQDFRKPGAKGVVSLDMRRGLFGLRIVDATKFGKPIYDDETKGDLLGARSRIEAIGDDPVQLHPIRHRDHERAVRLHLPTQARVVDPPLDVHLGQHELLGVRRRSDRHRPEDGRPRRGVLRKRPGAGLELPAARGPQRGRVGVVRRVHRLPDRRGVADRASCRDRIGDERIAKRAEQLLLVRRGQATPGQPFGVACDRLDLGAAQRVGAVLGQDGLRIGTIRRIPPRTARRPEAQAGGERYPTVHPLVGVGVGGLAAPVAPNTQYGLPASWVLSCATSCACSSNVCGCPVRGSACVANQRSGGFFVR